MSSLRSSARRGTPFSHLGRAAAVVATVTALTLTGVSAAAAAGPSSALRANDLARGDYTAVTETNTDFTIAATADKAVTVDGHERLSDRGEVFTQRIKLNGSGNEQARSLHFTVTDDEVPTQVFVNARSSSGTADRALGLYDASGLIATVPALADDGDQAVQTAAFDITAAGEYWLASPSSGVNVYYAQLGSFAEETRTAWSEVAAPVIIAAAVGAEPSMIEVQYSGASEADVVYATLYDSTGAVADQTLAPAEGSGTLRVRPPASGDYQVEVRATRFGEDLALSSLRTPVSAFSLPLSAPEITAALTTSLADGAATVGLTWTETPEADSYSVETSRGGATFETAVDGVTDLTAEVAGLTPGVTYAMRVLAHRGAETATGPAVEVEVADEIERWQIADVGSNAGSGGSVTENGDGTITFDARESSTKLASSEDGFQYFYTQIDPATENFTLHATFRVDDASSKDAQSGFGVIAVDDLVAGSSADRYFNSAAALVTRYPAEDGTSVDGLPGARFVRGYSGSTADNTAGARDTSGSAAFDLDWRSGVTAPRFDTGDEFELELRRSNTGFHASWYRDGEVFEVIDYDPDALLQQNPDTMYVGMAVARKIAVTVTGWEFTTVRPEDDDPAQQPPTRYVTPTLTVDVTGTTPLTTIDVPFVANVYGTGQVMDARGALLADEVALIPGTRVETTVPLQQGVNELTVRLLPETEQPHLGEREELASTDPVDVPLTVTVASYGVPGQSLWAAPEGTADGAGTKASPLDLHTAVAFAQPGQQIVLQPGTYTPTRSITIDRGRGGTEDQPITLMSAPGSRAVIDLSGSADGGLILRGDWWHIYNLEITGALDGQKALYIQGNHNTIERVESHHNGETGIQIAGSSTEPVELWPSHNLVVSSVSHNNADADGNDADGFAAKLTVGEGNVFRSDIAYNNVDDGWDLYAKSTTGAIGTVVIEDSVAYDNGWTEDDPTRTGEGNGFKLGGESVPGDHLLRNSISYGNLATGVTSNSGPDIRLQSVTSVGNARGVRLETNAATTDYAATGVLSWLSPEHDALELKQDDQSLLTDPSNVWNLGETSPVDEGWFVAVDLDGIRPTIAADGSVDMHGLLELTDAAPAGTGARLVPIENPTAIEVWPEAGSTECAGHPGKGGDRPGKGGDRPGKGGDRPGKGQGTGHGDGKGDGKGHGHGNGKGHSDGKGSGHGAGKGQGAGKGHGAGSGGFGGPHGLARGRV